MYQLFKNRLKFIIFGLLLGLLLIEILMRGMEVLRENKLFGIKPLRTTLIWIENNYIGKFLLLPYSSGWFVSPTKEYSNFVQANSQGFYDSEHKLNKLADSYRILILGDSFTASLQTPLNNTFFKILEKNLNNQGFKKKIEIISMGLGDTGTAQQYIALKLLGLKYNPDLVIQMFLTANDFKNNSQKLQNDPYRPYFLTSNNGELVEIQHIKRKDQKFYQVKDMIKKIRIVEFILFIRQKILETTSKNLNGYPLDYHIYDEYYNKDYADAVLITEKIILQTRDLVKKQNGKYMLIILVNNEQINSRAWHEIQKTYPKINKAKINLEKPDNIIREICKKNNLDCLFMLPFFKDFIHNNLNIETHYFYDGHWNQIGTNLAADFLTKNLLIFLKNNEKNL